LSDSFVDKPDTISPYMKQLMDETKQEQLEATSQSSGNLDIHAELGGPFTYYL